MDKTRQNYDALFEKILSENKDSKVLLHSCCAPCATQAFFRLEGAKKTAFFYNPNIMPSDEFELRYSSMQKLCDRLDIELIKPPHNSDEFISLVRGKEHLPEGGERCHICFYDRLYRSASYAKENGYDMFCTTLTLSPHKDSKVINKIGQKIGQELGIIYLPSDLKKQGGYQNSIKLSQKYGLYRQKYCGCKFSLAK